MSEDDVRLLGFQDLAELVVVGKVNDGPAIDLSRVQRTCLEDPAGFRCLINAATCLLGWAAGRLAVVQIEESHVMTEVGIAGDGASTAVLGIAGMAAGDDDFEFARAAPARPRLAMHFRARPPGPSPSVLR
jgi:hypothetical protein